MLSACIWDLPFHPLLLSPSGGNNLGGSASKLVTNRPLLPLGMHDDLWLHNT